MFNMIPDPFMGKKSPSSVISTTAEVAVKFSGSTASVTFRSAYTKSVIYIYYVSTE